MRDFVTKTITKLIEPDLIVQFGNQSLHSTDIDLLIVSDNFDGISTFKRKQLIKQISQFIDPLCLTPLQFDRLKKSNCSLYKSILLNPIIFHGNISAFI